MKMRPVQQSRIFRMTLAMGLIAILALVLGACGGAGETAGTQAGSSAGETKATPTVSAGATKEATAEATAEATTEATKEATPAATKEATTGTMTETTTTGPGSITSTESMSNSTGSNAAGSTTAGSSAGSELVMLHASGSHGDVLTDNKGMALYVFDKDSEGKSACTGDCLTKWPPFTVANASELDKVASGVHGKLGTITREDDGKLQVTINGLPLYHYYEDKQAGDTNGQAVGDVWWLVNAEGGKVSK